MLTPNRRVPGAPFSAAAAAVLLISSAADARIACESAKPRGAHAYYSWREIDGHRCWYVGHRSLSKAALYWPRDAERSDPRSQSLPVPAVPISVAPVPAVSRPVPITPFAERWPR